MRLFFIFFSVFSFSIGFSQDTIVRKNGDLLNVKVTEIGMEEIKFKASGVPDSPVITMKKSEIRSVKVGGQILFEIKATPQDTVEDLIIKKDGTTLKVNVLEIGTGEIKFKLFNETSGPTISIAKSEIKTLKVGGQTIIDAKVPKEDIILKKDGSSLRVKVLEIRSDDVVFKLANNAIGPTLSLKKAEIKTISVDGQTVYEYVPDPYSISHSGILNKNSSLKFHFFSPLNSHLAFTYEWMQKPGFNWEVGFGIVNRSVSARKRNIDGSTPSGAFLRFGPKFLIGSTSDIEIEGARYSHPLKGRFIKLEVLLHALNVKYTWDSTRYFGRGGMQIYTKEYQSLNLNLIYGRQYIYGNSITVAWYGGFGYGFESVERNGTLPPGTWQQWDNFDPRRYSHIYLGENFPMSLTAGFTIGYIFPTPKFISTRKYDSNRGAPFDSETTNFKK